MTGQTKWPQFAPGEIETGYLENFLCERIVRHWHSCPGKWWSHHAWSYLKDMQMCCTGTWLSGGLGTAELMVGLGYLKGLFQFPWFYNSVITKKKSGSESSKMPLRSFVLRPQADAALCFLQRFVLKVPKRQSKKPKACLPFNKE